jgi:hypothetical protein
MVRWAKFSSDHPQDASPVFLVGEPKTVSNVVRQRLPSYMGLLVALAGVVVIPESAMLIQERKDKRLPKRRLRSVRRTTVAEEKAKKTFVGKVVALISLKKN